MKLPKPHTILLLISLSAAINIFSDMDDFALRIKNDSDPTSPFEGNVALQPPNLASENRKLRSQLQTVKSKLLDLRETTRKLQQLNEENAELQRRLAKARGDLGLCAEDGHSLSRKLEESRRAADNCADDLHNLRAEGAQCKSKVQGLQAIIGGLENSRPPSEDQASQVKVLTAKVGTLEVELAGQRQGLSACQADSQSLKGRLEAQSAIGDALKGEVRDISNRLSECRDEGLKLVSGSNDSRAQIAGLTADNQALKEENSGLNKRLETFDENLQKLANLQSSLAKSEDSKREVSSKAQSLETELGKKREELKACGEEVKSGKARADESDRQIELLRTSNKKLFGDWQSQLAISQKCQDSSHINSENLAKREQEINDLNAKLKDFSQQISSAKKNVKDLEDILKGKDSLIAGFASKETECKKLESEVENFQINIQNLRVEISQKNSRIEEQKSSISGCQLEAEKLQFKVAGISVDNENNAQKLAQCQKDSESFKLDLEQIKKDNESLSAENKKLNELASQPNAQSKKLELRIVELEKILSDSQFGVAELDKCRSSLQNYLKDLELFGNKNLALEKQLTSQKESNQECQTVLQAFRKKHSEFQTKFNDLIDETKTLKANYSNFKQAFDSQTLEFASLKSQYGSVSKQLGECSTARASLQNEQTSLKLQVVDLGATINRLKGEQLDCQEVKMRLGEFKQQFEVCKFSLEQLKSEKNSNFDFIKKLTDEIAGLKIANDRFSSESNHCNSEKRALLEKLDSCEQKSKDLLNEISTLKTQNSNLSSNLNEAQFSLKLMSSKQMQCSQNLKDLDFQLEDLKKSFDRCSCDAANQKNQISDLQQTVESLKREISSKGDVQQINEKLAKELETLKSSLLSLKGDLEAENRERSKNASQLGLLIQKLTGSPNSYHDLIEKLTRSTKQIEIISQLIFFIDSSVSNLINEKSTLEKSNAALQTKISDLALQLQKSDQQKAVLESEKQVLTSKLSDCQGEKSNLALQNQKANSDLSTCNDQLNILRKGQADCQTQLQKCSADFGSFQVNFANLSNSHNACLAENRNHLTKIGELTKLKESAENDLRACLEASSKQTAQNNDLNNRLNSCNDSFNKLRADFGALQANFSNANQRLSDCGSDNQKLNIQLVAMNGDNKVLNSQLLGLKGNLENAVKALSDCNVQKEQMGKVAADLRASVDSISAKFSSLVQEFDDFKKSCSGIKDENASLKHKISELQVTIENLKSSVEIGDACKIDLGRCSDKSDGLSKEIALLRESNHQLSSNISHLSSNLSELKSSLNNIGKERETCLAENLNFKNRIENLSAEIQNLNARNIDLSKQRDSLEGQNQKCKEQLFTLNVQISNLNNELAEKSKCGPFLQECSSNFSALKDQANSLKTKISDYEITNQNLLKNLNNKDSQLETFRAEVARLNNDIANLTKLYSNEKAQSEDCARKISEANKALDKLSTENERLNSIINNLKAENIRLSDAWTRAQEGLKEGQLCQNELFACRKNFESCSANASKFESALKVLEAEVAGKNEQIKLLRENMETIKVELEKLKTEQKSFFVTVTGHKRDLLNKISDLEAERAKLLGQINSFGEENNNLKVQIAKLTVQNSICDDKDKKLTQLTNSYDDLFSRFNQLKSNFDELQTTLKQRAQQISQLELKIAHATDSASQLQTDKDRINKELVSAQGEITALKIQRDFLKTSNSEYLDQVNSLSGRLKNLESQLNDCNSQKQGLNQKIALLEESERKCLALKKEFSDLQSTADLLKSALADCNKSRSNSEAIFTDCRNTVNEINIKFANCQNDSAKTISNFRNDIDRFQLEIKNLSTSLGESKVREENCRTNLSQCASSSHNFAEELKRYISKLEDCKAGEEKLQACKLDLQAERFSGQAKDKALGDLRVQLDSNISLSAQCQGQLRDCQASGRKLEGENAQLGARVENLRQDLSACASARKEDLASWSVQIQGLKSQLEESEKKLAACRNEAFLLQKDYQFLSGEFEKCKARDRLNAEKLAKLEAIAGGLEKIQAQLDKSLQAISSLQKENADLAQFKALYQKALREIDQMNAAFNLQIQTCNRERAQLQENFNTIADKVLSLENQLKLAQEKIVLLSANSQALNEDKRALVYKLSQCEFSLKELEARAGNLASCSGDLAKLRDQVKYLQASLEGLAREKAQLEAKLQNSNSQLAQLTAKFRFLITKLEFMNVVKREKMNDVHSVIAGSQDEDLKNRIFVGSSFESDLK